MFVSCDSLVISSYIWFLCSLFPSRIPDWGYFHRFALIFIYYYYFYAYIFFLLSFFLFYFVLLYNTVLVLPYINMNLLWVYMSSQSWTPLPPPSPYHLSGSSQCTSPKHPISCIEPRLAIFSYMIVYMLHCHSPKASHPLPLPQSPKDCSIHLCLFCSLAYSVIFLNSIFLNSIYMC